MTTSATMLEDSVTTEMNVATPRERVFPALTDARQLSR